MAKNNTTDESLEEVAQLPGTEGNLIEREADETLLSSLKESIADDDDEDWWKDEDDYSVAERKDLYDLYNSTIRVFEINKIVSGTVVTKTDKEVLLNIGYKSEGIVSVSEFRDTPNLKAGDTVEVLIEATEDKGGQLRLSRKKAKSQRTWENINNALDGQLILEGQVMRRTKGGFVVDIQGIEAFLPGSQIDVKPVKDFDVYVNRIMEFKVVKINPTYENVVVSHKILIEDKINEQRIEILKNLERGQVLEGTVKNMTAFGVFIDLGGVDGLLHITDISWGRVSHPSEVLRLDEKVNVVVLEFDEDKKRISLGMKQLQEHPWENLPTEFVEGAKVKGKIVTVADYGIFIEVIPGIEGLIHTSEMSWSSHGAKTPTELYKAGQDIEAIILNIDKGERKMSLGLKQLKSDPWATVPEVYALGTKHTGIVRNMTNYGLFVELEEGVDGLVHISDLSWVKKFNHPSEYVKLDEPIEIIVLSLDVENRKLSLGHKQLTEDVWETFSSVFTIGSIHKGTIKKIDGKGAFVETEFGVEGFCPLKALKVAEGQTELTADSVAEFEITEFNKDAKRISLSHTNTWQKKAEEEVTEKKITKVKAKNKDIETGDNSAMGDNEALAQLKEKMEAKTEVVATAEVVAAEVVAPAEVVAAPEVVATEVAPTTEEPATEEK